MISKPDHLVNPQPVTTIELPPLRPSRPYLCVAVPVGLARKAQETGVTVLSCVDPLGKRVYDQTVTRIIERGLLFGNDLITPLSDWEAQKQR